MLLRHIRATQNVVPVAVTAGDKIASHRSATSNRCLAHRASTHLPAPRTRAWRPGLRVENQYASGANLTGGNSSSKRTTR
jgi:hypothetical protein